MMTPERKLIIKTIIITLLVVALLIGAYFFLAYQNNLAYNQGLEVCSKQTYQYMVNSIQQQGYFPIVVNNQTYKVGVLG